MQLSLKMIALKSAIAKLVFERNNKKRIDDNTSRNKKAGQN
jgi:hypothetical protein